MRLPDHVISAISCISLDQCPFDVIRKYISGMINLGKHRCHIWFLKNCSKYNILPRFITDIKLPKNLNYRCVNRIQKHVLRSCMKSHYSMMEKLTPINNFYGEELNQYLSPSKVSYISHVATMATNMEMESIKANQRKKMRNLILKSHNEHENNSQTMRNFENQSDEYRTPTASHLSVSRPTTSNSDMISVIGDLSITSTQKMLLERGPKFIPTRKLDEKVATELRISLAHMAYQLRWQSYRNSNKPNNSITNSDGSAQQHHIIPRPNWCPFENQRFPPPHASSSMERKLHSLVDAVENLIEHESKFPSSINNLSRSERNSIKEMKQDDNIYISSDKGGEMVVIPEVHYHALAMEHLNDGNTYEQLSNDPTRHEELSINDLWKSTEASSMLPKSMIEKLKSRHSTISQFYFLPKTHKSKLAVRPIVSSIGSPCEKMAWLLQQILKHFISEVPAHLESTQQLLSRLGALSPNQLTGKMPISLDVVSLYTNIDTQEAMTIISQLLRRKFHHSVWGISIDVILDILSFILRNNSFHYENRFFRQIRGLAMGSKLSPTVAILVMDHLERSSLFLRTVGNPLAFLRFIDDCVLIIERDVDVKNLLANVNKIHHSIKFELESTRCDGFLPVLDTAINIDNNGNFKYKFYQKEANRGLFINATSALPSHIKTNSAVEEFRRVSKLCSDDRDRKMATSHLCDKLLKNGYVSDDIKRYHSQSKNARRNSRFSISEDACVLKVPFISDKFNYKLQRLVRNSGFDVRVVNRPGVNISRQLNKIKRYKVCSKRSCIINDPSICCIRNVVYKGLCNSCNEFYIGSTTRPFHDRVAEHLQPSRRTSIYKHASLCHEKLPKNIFTFSVISKHDSFIRCRIAEAMTIKRMCPSLNGRDEFVDFNLFLI